MKNTRPLIVAVLVLGGAATAMVLADKDGNVHEAAPPTTTTTAAPAATAFPVAAPTRSEPTTGASTTTTGAARQSTATTAARAATTPTTRASTATAASPGVTTAASCGAGEATAAFAPRDEVNITGAYSFTPTVVVTNNVNTDIVLGELSLEVAFPTSGPQTVRFAVSGLHVASGATATFSADKVSSTEHYTSFRFTRFTYAPNGRPACLVSSP
ncbi:MAG TPA: hypothetical protein VFJ85_06520 [Acidimicrobiales bacterium]|nr:hypothetical protein [Acidimicrobiales bacterium]